MGTDIIDTELTMDEINALIEAATGTSDTVNTTNTSTTNTIGSNMASNTEGYGFEIFEDDYPHDEWDTRVRVNPNVCSSDAAISQVIASDKSASIAADAEMARALYELEQSGNTPGNTPGNITNNGYEKFYHEGVGNFTDTNDIQNGVEYTYTFNTSSEDEGNKGGFDAEDDSSDDPAERYLNQIDLTDDEEFDDPVIVGNFDYEDGPEDGIHYTNNDVGPSITHYDYRGYNSYNNPAACSSGSTYHDGIYHDTISPDTISPTITFQEQTPDGRWITRTATAQTQQYYENEREKTNKTAQDYVKLYGYNGQSGYDRHYGNGGSTNGGSATNKIITPPPAHTRQQIRKMYNAETDYDSEGEGYIEYASKPERQNRHVSYIEYINATRDKPYMGKPKRTKRKNKNPHVPCSEARRKVKDIVGLPDDEYENDSDGEGYLEYADRPENRGRYVSYIEYANWKKSIMEQAPKDDFTYHDDIWGPRFVDNRRADNRRADNRRTGNRQNTHNGWDNGRWSSGYYGNRLPDPAEIQRRIETQRIEKFINDKTKLNRVRHIMDRFIRSNYACSSKDTRPEGSILADILCDETKYKRTKCGAYLLKNIGLLHTHIRHEDDYDAVLDAMTFLVIRKCEKPFNIA